MSTDQIDSEVIEVLYDATPPATPSLLQTTPHDDPGNGTWPQGDLFLWNGGGLLFLPLMMFVGVLGNMLVFYIYHFRWRSNTVTLFKRMLAVLDLIALFISWPIILYNIVVPQSPHFREMCVFTSYVALVSAVASGYLLVVIAADRFMKLCLLRKAGISREQAKKLFALCLALSFAQNIPVGWVFGRDSIKFTHHNVQVDYCFIDTEAATILWVWAGYTNLVFGSITTVLSVLYIKIFMQLKVLSKRHDELKRRPSVLPSNETVQRQKQSKLMMKSAYVFFVVTGVFFMTYTPYFVTLILAFVDSSVEGSMDPWQKALYDIAKFFPIMSNVANPFIYSFTSDSFLQEVKKMLTFKTCQKDGFFRRRAFSLASRTGTDQELSNMDSECSRRESERGTHNGPSVAEHV